MLVVPKTYFEDCDSYNMKVTGSLFHHHQMGGVFPVLIDLIGLITLIDYQSIEVSDNRFQNLGRFPALNNSIHVHVYLVYFIYNIWLSKTQKIIIASQWFGMILELLTYKIMYTCIHVYSRLCSRIFV